MQLMKVDMTNRTHRCPQGLAKYSHNRKHVCRRESSSGGCSSVNIAAHGIDYSRVCEKVITYQYASPDGFHTGNDNIDSGYLDGVSITHGRYPCKHIWSFAAIHDERVSYGQCPCINHYASIYLRPQVSLGMTISAMLLVRARGHILSIAVIHYGMAVDVEQQIAAALETVPHNSSKPWIHLPTITLN